MTLAKKALVLGILVGLFSASFVLADVMMYNKNDYVKFVATDVGLTQAYTEYRLCNPSLVDKLTNKRSLQDFDWEFEVVKGVLTDSWFEIKVKEYYEKNVYDYFETCEPYTAPNKTLVDNCTTTVKERTVEKWRWEWEKFNPQKFNYRSKECYNIRIYGTYPIAYGNDILIDNIISFAGHRFEEYAWWDFSYGFRYIDETNVTALPNVHSFNDNRTFGNSYTAWVGNASGSTGENIYLYCEDSDCATGDIAMGNETNEVPWEMDNGTGYMTDTLHENMYGVYHFDTLNDSALLGQDCSYVGTHTVNTSGIYGNARTFAADTNPSCSFAVIQPTVKFTITWWASMTGAANSQYIWQSYDSGIYLSTSGGKWYFGTRDAGGWPVLNDVAIDISGTWHHYAFMWNGTHNSLYIDAVLADGPDLAGNRIDAGDADNLGKILTGTIDELRIYNDTALTLTQIQEEYYNVINQSSLGAEEAGGAGPISEVFINISMLSPTNTTYATTSITINGTVNDTANVTWSDDGGANQTACEICTDFENITALAEGAHNISVYAVYHNNSSVVDDSQIFFLIDLTPPTVTITNPTGTNQTNATIPLNFAATDALSAIDECWYSLNNATNTSLAGCANTTFAVTQAGTHNISVYANDTAGWEGVNSNSFIYDPLQNFTANDSLSGEQIADFQVVVVGYASGSTTNGTAPILSSAIGYGSRIIRFVASGFNTTEFNRTFTNETLLTENFTIIPSITNITVYDETQAGLGILTNITFNITITNTTQSTTWYNQSEFTEYANSTPSGDVTIDLSSYGYQSRRYYVTISDNTANAFTGYLLPTTDALYVRFNIRTITEQAIEGALVTAERFISSSWVTVGQRLSDEAGTAAIHLNPTVSYKINVTATGYIGQYLTLTPSNTDYRIYMQSAIGADTWQTGLTNVSMTFTPTITSLNITITNFVCWITASDDSLVYVAFNITHGNGTVLFNNLTTTTSGALMNVTLDLALLNDTNMTAVCLFQRTGYDPFNATRTYFVFNQTGGALESGLQNLVSSGFTSFTLGMVSIIISAVLAGGVTGISRNGFAGAMVGALVMAVFTFYLNWFDWKTYLLMITTLGAFLIIRGQGGVR